MNRKDRYYFGTALFSISIGIITLFLLILTVHPSGIIAAWVSIVLTVVMLAPPLLVLVLPIKEAPDEQTPTPSPPTGSES